MGEAPGRDQPASELFPLVAETDADILINRKDESDRKRSFGKALAARGKNGMP